MQVSVETTEGLERKITVQIPAETVDMEVENRLKSMQGRVKIDGFRPGKVPLKESKSCTRINPSDPPCSHRVQRPAVHGALMKG